MFSNITNQYSIIAQNNPGKEVVERVCANMEKFEIATETIALFDLLSTGFWQVWYPLAISLESPSEKSILEV